MTALDSETDEFKVLKEKIKSYLEGMLNISLSNPDYESDYNDGKELRPKDDKLAEETEKNDILTIDAKPFSFEGILNEIRTNTDYGNFFVRMIGAQRFNPKIKQKTQE